VTILYQYVDVRTVIRIFTPHWISAAFLAVQARGAISVLALARGTESLLPRPFARCRALKGD
jgi:hypothetical protein